jgi:fatty-acyl-CoA synthase
MGGAARVEGMDSKDPGTTGAEERVLEVVRALAGEVGGERALRAVSPDASLERDLGLGSLERAELLLRLESAFGRSFEDGLLEADTPAALARLVRSSPGETQPLPGRPQTEVSAAHALKDSVGTLCAALRQRAEDDPGRPHVFLRSDDDKEETLTYGRLLEEARLVAGGLRERGIEKGATVAVMLPTGTDFLRTFQGILWAGAIPVPLYPPVRIDRLAEYAERQSAILRDAGASLLVTLPEAKPLARLLEGVASVVTPEALVSMRYRPEDAAGEPGGPALIQYTSGSTGRPKGVLLTHANLLANIRAIAAGLDARPTDVGVSWLPLYHDMGLIGSWLFCLAQGLPIELLPPLAFLARPERWLWALHRRRGTLSAAPNFAYELCVRRIPETAIEGLDLSAWRCAFNGAEPVSPDTLDRFSKKFAPYGFRSTAFLPVYGLAENSVALCVPPLDRGSRVDEVDRARFEKEGRAEAAGPEDPRPLRFVSSGIPLPLHEVRILEETGGDAGERRVGRLVFRGPSMTPGYFRNEEATAAVTVEGGWLDSGDLAYRADGEIFVTGRLKDLIIKAGRNLVPQEIEELASSIEGIRKGCVVALGLPNEAQGTESLVVVCETRTRAAGRDALVSRVRERILDGLGVPPDDVRLVPPGSIPKTPSGKVRRSATLDLLRSGALGQAPRASLSTRLRVTLPFLGSRLLRPLLGAARLAYGIYLVLLLFAAAAVVWPLALLLPNSAGVQSLARTTARVLLRLAGFRLEVSGLEHLPGKGPLLLASNHASYLDILVLLALLPLEFLFVAKQEIRSWPIVGTFIRRLGHLTVERGDHGQSLAAAADVEKATRGGRSVLVFPEATFTRASGLRPFRLGVFKTAVETGTRVVPLALRGTRTALRDGALLPRPGRLSLWIGAPLAPEGEGWSSVVSLRDRIQGLIAAHCGEPLLQMISGGVPRP